MAIIFTVGTLNVFYKHSCLDVGGGINKHTVVKED